MATVRHRPSSRNGDSYRTPDWLYRALDAEFRFTLDPCPFDPQWSEERVQQGLSLDGLQLDWSRQRVFVNPPYPTILLWVQKALASPALTVLLLPVRSDTEWFHLLLARAELRFFRKRVDFTTATGKTIHPAESSVVAIVRGYACNQSLPPILKTDLVGINTLPSFTFR